MKIYEKVTLYSSLAMSLFASVTMVLPKSNKPVGFIDIGRLTANYKLKADMEKEGNANLLKIRNSVDSLKILAKTGASEHIDSMVKNGNTALEKYYAYLEREMSTKVWERLNPQLQEFGEKNGVSMIIGANGRGNVLYGDVSVDLTDKAIEFVNRKYEKSN